MSFQSLYAHFPFCETKCHYCDFYSIGVERTREGDALQFETALRQEALLWKGQFPKKWDTVFFGGGTPSMTPPDSMQRALEPSGFFDRISKETEWTLEANPSSIEKDQIRAYRALGVNRVSMGVQAMRDDLLLRLGRVHSRDRALFALDAVFQAGIENMSVDLLCGVPGQSLADLESAMEALTSFPITHLSCYLLTLSPTHRMTKELPGEDEQLRHLLFIHDFMSSKKFEHYEISNFSKPGYPARHNLNYWTGAGYLGLGPSAHSYDPEQKKRWKNISSLHAYGKKLGEGARPVEWEESLTSEQQNMEKWLLAIRLDQGFPEAWIESDRQKRNIDKLVKEGHLERHPTKPHFWRCTPRGFALSDQIVTMIS